MTYNTINIKLNQNLNLICYLIQNIHSISNDREATLSVINMREVCRINNEKCESPKHF